MSLFISSHPLRLAGPSTSSRRLISCCPRLYKERSMGKPVGPVYEYDKYAPHPHRNPDRWTSKPVLTPHLPPGFTFYPNHKQYPIVPVPDVDKMYVSDIPPPPLPRTSVFHYLFPPKRKGRHFRFYPATDPSAVAFVDGLTGRKLYRDEVPVRAMWLTSGLRRLGIKRGDVVCIFGQNSIEWAEANFGIQGCGSITSPANYGYTAEELLYQLTDSGAKAIFVQPELVPTLEKALSLAPTGYSIRKDRIFLMCEYADKPENTPYSAMSEIWNKQAIPRQLVGQEEKETAYLCYSSGTTGRAKGVETSHHNMTSQIQAVNLAYEPLNQHSPILGVLPFGHIYGLTLLLHQPLTSATPVIVLPKFDVEKVLWAIEAYRIGFALMVPPMLIALMNSPLWDKYDLTTLRGIQTGAAPCSMDLINAFEAKFPTRKIFGRPGDPLKEIPICRITQGYGLTETSPVSHVMTVAEGAKHQGKIGKIIPTMQARLVDHDTGKDVEVGEKGELWLRGTSVMKGYWKNDEATKAAFAPGGWFKTGDVATVDEEGYFAIVDRVKELIKYKGYQVPPAELEALLLTHPKVADAGVIGIYSESQATELPRAYVVPKAGLAALSEAQQKEFEQEVIDWVASKVSNPKRLRGGVKCVAEIPKSPSGKILRKNMREAAKGENLEEELKSREAKL